ncbi:hypothetical protein ACIBG0_38270 [Nocardia sp. NPDC050630]|uniref:hypothetical protein n=1 Tax=Nocardia sp. NPDC050630 TaxID=3364321 RepID=UPI0037A4E428
MSNGITRALVKIMHDLTHDLTRLTRRGAEGAADIDWGAARFVKGDVDEKLRADRRGGHEVEQAGVALTATERRQVSAPDPAVGHSGRVASSTDELAGNTPASPRESGGMFGGPGDLEVTTGLGAEVDSIVSLSPKSVKRIKDVQDAGWTIRLGPAGEGTRTHRASKVIAIAEDSSAEHRASAILHEVGHAHPESERPPTVVTYNGEGRARWAVKCAQPHFRDEGQAVFHEVEGLYEIADNGGPRILPASSKPQEYLSIYDQHVRGEMTKETAIHEMGQKYADEAQSDGRTYRSRFVGIYEDVFDQNPMDEVFAEHGPINVTVSWPGGAP